MGRAYQFRETRASGDHSLNPIWRGVGFLVLVGLTIGAFWLAGVLLERNWQQPFLPFSVPRNFVVQLPWGLPALPGKLLVQIGAAVLIDLIAYALMVIIYGILRPMRRGPADAAQPRVRRRRSMTR